MTASDYSFNVSVDRETYYSIQYISKTRGIQAAELIRELVTEYMKAAAAAERTTNE